MFKIVTDDVELCVRVASEDAADIVVHDYKKVRTLTGVVERLRSAGVAILEKRMKRRTWYPLAGGGRLAPLRLPRMRWLRAPVDADWPITAAGLDEGSQYVQLRPELFGPWPRVGATRLSYDPLPASVAVVAVVRDVETWHAIGRRLCDGVAPGALFVAVPGSATALAAIVRAARPDALVSLPGPVDHMLGVVFELYHRGSLQAFEAVHVLAPVLPAGSPLPLRAAIFENHLIALFGNDHHRPLSNQIPKGGVAMVVDDGAAPRRRDGEEEAATLFNPFYRELRKSLDVSYRPFGHRFGFAVPVAVLDDLRVLGVSGADFSGPNGSATGAAVEWLLQANILVRGGRVFRTASSAAFHAPWDEDVLEAAWTELRAPTDVSGRDVCLFVTFTADQRVAPHAVHYMTEMKARGHYVFCLVVSGRTTLDVAPPPPEVADAVAVRANIGYDFALWAACLRRHPEIWGARTLLLANDSVIGPLGSSDDLWKRIETSKADVLALTVSSQIVRHFQSFFLWFGPKALESEDLRRFWASVRTLPDKDLVIHAYELRMLHKLEWSGLVCDALYPIAAEGAAEAFNPSINGWRALLEARCPFIKVQLLRDNPTNEDLDDWKERVRSAGFDADFVEAMLRARSPKAVALGVVEK